MSAAPDPAGESPATSALPGSLRASTPAEPGFTPSIAPASLDAAGLRHLQQRSNARGLQRLAAHLAVLGAALALHALSLQRPSAWPLHVVTATAYGFTLVTLFAAMHEAVHRTAFRSQWLNDTVAWFAGLLSFYNSTFYRPYHGWHHRFTQLPGKDPELEDLKPTNFGSYLLELSGALWWVGKLQTYWTLCRGDYSAYPFLTERSGPLVVRSVRLQMLTYLAAIAGSFWLGRALFVDYWLLPVAFAQPLLRAILLAEHTGCTQDGNSLSNTRTTHTVFLVRLLMWEMPYHAEHHRYPALPFFSLAAAHTAIGPELKHVARAGYLGFHVELCKQFGSGKTTEPSA